MKNPISYELDNARQVILEVINENVKNEPSHFETSHILRQVSDRLDIKYNTEAEEAVLTIWHDLFRIGILAPGYDFRNPNLPFVHMTDAGRASLANVSRDPSNPDGYLAHLSSQHLTDAVALSYIQEAVMTYNSACHKAAAVMVGCATERLVVLIQDELIAGLERQGKSVSNNLKDWRYKTIRDAITTEFDSQLQNIQPQRLKESYSAFWTSFTEQLRLYRNDAGHPKSIDPVSPEIVHSNLLIFPELAKLVAELLAWIKENYS